MHQSSTLPVKLLKVAILARTMATEADEIVFEAFANNGHQSFIIEPDSNKSVIAKPDLYVMTGPYKTLAPAIKYLEMHQDKTPLIYWFTESIPSPTWPRMLAGLLAKFRYRIDGPIYRTKTFPLRSSLPELGRLRAFGEMLYLYKAKRLTLLVTPTEHRASYFRDLGLPAISLSMGYAPIFGRDLAKTRDIDVIFIGSTRDRRRGKIIMELKRKLGNIGVSMVIKDGSQQHGYAFGDQRTMLLNRSKIALNIMRQPWDSFVYRTLISSANKAMVLSEPMLDPGPFSLGEHFAESEISKLAEAVRYYLENSQERERIATSAHQYVTKDLTMERMVKQLLTILVERNVLKKPLG